jgi:transposase
LVNTVVCNVIGGVDTHKDLHVWAVVDKCNHVLGSQYFATTRHGYKQVLDRMRSFGPLQRIGVEGTGTYGAGLLRCTQNAGIEVLDVTTPNKYGRRKRRKTMIWMPKMPRTQLSPANAPSRLKAATG